MTGSLVHHLRDNIAVVGWACRLPGANSVDAFWSLLLERRCAISRVPEDRFSLERFGHPRKQERGKSYTWAAGILDDIWGFDPGVFGISPREAVQIDPQQRILLQLTWEALEDAGIPPSSIAGTEVGVYIGASQTDYGHAFFGDPSIADAHFGPGTALAILANRISYAYGLHGPSMTVDTACSSSLVALHQAVEALRSGRVDTAIVGGSNLIASPASFIAFSQANMLSPRGLCQAFSAKADGFVRAEGAVVMILRKAAQAHAKQNPVRGYVLATDVNSDGRTNGIALPSIDAQEALLRRVYARNDIDYNRLAFIEAHGTGTPAGDPIEANAIGRSIGRNRTEALPIGSVKTNIGHLEPASGLAGALKAMLALKHGVLPASLHFDEPNPHIDFAELNLNVCDQPLLLPRSAEQLAGVNSFGFGGTNAHAIFAPARKMVPTTVDHTKHNDRLFTISAESSGALNALAKAYADQVVELSDADTAVLASAVAHRRELQPHRIVVSTTRSADVARSLNAYMAGIENPNLTTGVAVGRELPVAFVYAGNGSQWVGMGRAPYRNNARFRARFDEIDAYFKQIGGWSLKERLFSDTLAECLSATSIAQPLIFAVQCACTAALQSVGLRPAVVLGHSVGEVAAAEAAGILDLRTAIKVIHFRSTSQELTQGTGRMAAVLATEEVVRDLCADVDGVEIAAFNSPRATTVAGSVASLARFKERASSAGIALLDLDLDYPFHTVLMAPIEPSLRADLRDIVAHDADVPFVSTVTGACLPGSRLDGSYWWRNVREPVHFMDAVRAAAELGARYFVEIGPRPTILKHITDSLQGEISAFSALAVLDRNDDAADPFERTLAKAMVAGARIDTAMIFGPDPGPLIRLPHYPWQQTSYRFEPTVESSETEIGRHPFAGARTNTDALIWRSHIDTALLPDLADHKLGEQVIFPGTGFLEIALSVARQWLRTDQVLIGEFEILQPLDLTNGETREVMTRVSPGANTLEILSRPRLSLASWIMHVRCKVHAGSAPDRADVPKPPANGRIWSAAELYALAGASGLNYGAAFRLARDITSGEDGLIAVELAPSITRESEFSLDPMRLDAGAHGFFTLFPALQAVDRGVTYIPVRIQEAALYRPQVAPARMLIHITTKNDRAIVGDCFVLDRDNDFIAVLRGVRTQAINIRRAARLETAAFIELPQTIDGTILDDVGVTPGPAGIIAHAKASGLIAADNDGGAAGMLIEGCATAAAYEIATGLAQDGVVDIDILLASRRLPQSLRPWLLHMLNRLAAADLAQGAGDVWTLRDEELPPSRSVVKALVIEHPDRAAEALCAAALSNVAQAVKSTGRVPAIEAVVTGAVLDFYHTTAKPALAMDEALFRLLDTYKRLWPRHRAVRVLQLGYGHLSTLLLSSERELQLTVFEPDRRRFEAAELAFSKNRQVKLIDAEHAGDLGRYDLIVSAASLHRMPAGVELDVLKRSLAPGGLMVAIEPGPSLFRDMVFGIDSDWFVIDAMDVPHSPLRPPKAWPGLLEAAGFADARSVPMRCADELAEVIVASKAESPDAVDTPALSPADVATTLIIDLAQETSVAASLAQVLTESGQAVTTLTSLDSFPEAPPNVLLLVPSVSSTDAATALTRRCLDIRACVDKLGRSPAKVWLVFAGALAHGKGEVRPVETGAWAFSRSLANEYPKLDVRRIDIAGKLPDAIAAERIGRILQSNTEETELQIDDCGVRAVRVQALPESEDVKSRKAHMAARLERRTGSGRRVSWQSAERRRPGNGEVEIEVEAAGLNFRDLMWSLSLLPDDMLEDGFSGPTLGLECAGRICRIGGGVRDVEVGDRVMAFAASSLSTHVTIGSGQVAKLPETMPAEAAATIPVAFFTAYYGLLAQAKLARGEWVLIHGGAGAVGMAAIQIAHARGAKVIATAGSPAKRELLRSLGVAHVFDSRSLSFVDDVRRVTDGGVDVVLNSLAGEAMERSVATLRPFGRFVELGKRDYVTNTHLGLRPFRRNLSYYGVDVDQVIAARRAESDKIFARIVRAFEKGTYVPLPYSVFDADDVSSAFHLMQQAGHVGKIVIRPPKSMQAKLAAASFTISSEKTHVVTGAFGGFGMETARWLADHGARHLALVGRRGATTPEAQELMRELNARGVKVLAEPCDIADRMQVERLFRRMRACMPPVAGVMHEAMVLDDGLLANLDAERFQRVLAPKVTGTDNLEQVLRGTALDYFVLFSSVTTLIGNPGQANYVAANAYMEGVARRRRQKGLPGIAIGWGPILDVGAVARDEKLQSGLQRLTGVSGLRAREGLDLLAQALTRGADAPAVITISPNDGSFATGRLPVLRSPSYAAYRGGAQRDGAVDGGWVDLRTLAAGEGIEAARRKVADVVTAKLAHVLHMREGDISPVRALGDIGLDSLMALELVMNLEECFGISIPLSGASGGLTISSIADEIIAHIELDRDDAVVSKLSEQHHGDIKPAQVKAVKEIMVREGRSQKRLLS